MKRFTALGECANCDSCIELVLVLSIVAAAAAVLGNHTRRIYGVISDLQRVKKKDKKKQSIMPNDRIRTFQYQRLGFVLGCLVYTTVLDLQSHMCSNRGPM